MKRGDLVGHFSGEWSSARFDIGVVLDFRKDRKNRDEALVWLPTYKHTLMWHLIDPWHLEHFWKVLT